MRIPTMATTAKSSTSVKALRVPKLDRPGDAVGRERGCGRALTVTPSLATPDIAVARRLENVGG